MTDRQAKDFTIAEFRRRYKICEAEYPYDSLRVLIWFEFRNDQLFYTQTPVKCDNTLYDRAMEIQKSPNFYEWGINPFTGKKAEVAIQWGTPWGLR